MRPSVAALGILLAIPRIASSASAELSEPSTACVICHQEKMPGLTGEWRSSKHFGADVGCHECHAADPKDPDAIEHNGFTIAVIVSPKDCSRCHRQEFEQFERSHHADAGAILGSLDNTLGEVVEGPAAAVTGCKQCHGGSVKILEGGELDPDTWPNSGIGRINPDGSKGSCAACHSRHAFSARLARMPDNCGKCHLGPDHPQKEIYQESKHGIAFLAHQARMNLDNSAWILGLDYTAAPTCATCHMSATGDLPRVHDVGDRISWTLRPPVSERVDAAAKKKGLEVKSWESRRADMRKVCTNCHTSSYVDAHYVQYDRIVGLYNDKFALPATQIYNALRDGGLVTKDPVFDDEVEWTYYLLWHHEGRRARMGAAMFAPDYAQWHGFFEVAERFYTDFLPQVDAILKKAGAEGGARAAAAVEVAKRVEGVKGSGDHRWFIGKMDPAEKTRRQKEADDFRQRYAR
ncbi:MAG: hydroxylamine oxidoreductase [Acidobacteriia bacterium]|nr:hydroxylamine oxidoreductase [Terriglobia bacterium]